MPLRKSDRIYQHSTLTGWSAAKRSAGETWNTERQKVEQRLSRLQWLRRLEKVDALSSAQADEIHELIRKNSRGDSILANEMLHLAEENRWRRLATRHRERLAKGA